MSKTYRISAAIIGFGYALFLGLFALDSGSFAGLTIHLLPSFAVIMVSYTGLKKAFAGGMFMFLIANIFTVFFHTYKNFQFFLVISMPLFLSSALFFISLAVSKKEA